MKILITILLLAITTIVDGQYRAPYYPKSHYVGAKVGAVVLVSTFITVESMKIPNDYYFTPQFNTRVRQKATVALTGMITTTATVLIVDAVKRKKHRNKVNRVCGVK